MANIALFTSVVGKLLPRADRLNHSLAPAYDYTPRHKLAQYAVTGCLNGTFYASAREQAETVLQLVQDIDPEFVAKVAIYCREKGHMKDMPALLAASLSVTGPEYLAPVFGRVVTNGKMLRNFVQIMRSGVVGRKSLGSLPKKLIQQWLTTATDIQLVRASVGQSPSLADVIKMVHPKPADKSREALFGYILGKDHDAELLPSEIRQFEAYKADQTAAVPKVPFQMLTSLGLKHEAWTEIARNAGWHMTRMNLNTFARHGVFTVEDMDRIIADRLRNPDEIRKAKVFPYQIMVAHSMISDDVPKMIGDALQDALETALDNVPQIEGHIVICPDVSGSMSSPVTGYRPGASSYVKCIDVAALIASAYLYRNKTARVLPYEDKVVNVRLNARDSIMTNAAKLAAIGGGWTDCSAPLRKLNREKAKVDMVVLVSDNESWVDNIRNSDTGVMREWARLKARNPAARLVCIDMQPYGMTQAKEREDILNIGGFSDSVFDIMASFARGELKADHWVGEIEKVKL